MVIHISCELDVSEEQVEVQVIHSIKAICKEILPTLFHTIPKPGNIFLCILRIYDAIIHFQIFFLCVQVGLLAVAFKISGFYLEKS